MVALMFGIRVWSDVVLTGPLDVDQTGIAAHKVLHLVLRSFPCEHTSRWVHHPNSAENVPGTSADNGKHHQYRRWGSTSGENPWWIHWITLLILKKKHRYQVSSLELHFPETSRNHGGAAQTPNISAIGQKSPPHAIFALWPDPRARVHGPPPVPWPAWTQKDARMHQIYPKGDFGSLLNDELSICCTDITNVEDVLLVEAPLVQRVLVHFPRVFETAPWLEIENTSQNLERCMGSKNLAIINPIKCLSPQDDSEFSYFLSILIIHMCHILSLFTHIW